MITYPLSMPDNGIRPARIVLTAQNVVSVSTSPFTFATQTFVHPGQRWAASVSLPQMRRSSAEPWISFLMSLKGQTGYFLLKDTGACAPRGAVTGTVRVAGGSQVGSTLAVDGLSPSLADAFKAGDYIQLGSGASARLHKVLVDASADSGGAATLDIWPDLRASPADNDVVTYQSASGLFKLVSNSQTWDLDNIALYGISFDCVEYVW